MKSLFRCLLLCLLPGMSCTFVSHAQPSSGGERLLNKAKMFFAFRPEGEETVFKDGRPLKRREIDRYRAEVWRVWREANRESTEEPLPPLSPLAGKPASKWHLPESLEPAAVMPFFWGSKGEKPDGGYPLYLYLHGSGDKSQEWQTGLRLALAFDDAPSVYFIPQIPNTGPYYRWWQKAKQHAWEKLLRQAFVSGEVDPDRVYFFGISEGGYGSQRLASFYADYLAGAGPMAGGEPLKNAPAENCRNMAFSLLTGAEDVGFYRNRLTGIVGEEFRRLSEADPSGYVHRIELIPGKGHHIDYRPTTEWLKTHKRDPYPRRIVWEDFEMDGLHRRGFYNIAVGKRPDGAGRTRYRMTIEENTVRLDIDEVRYETLETDPRWGIEMRFKKEYAKAVDGRCTIYLGPELVNLRRDVTVIVNGKKVFEGRLKPDVKHLVNSCALFFDPRRLYPAAVDVEY